MTVSIKPGWKDLFAPHILARGKSYFEKGLVRALAQDNNRITARVDGTEEYFVEIYLPGGAAADWSCSCPYADHGSCKHAAAVLFAVEEGEFTFTNEAYEFDEDEDEYDDEGEPSGLPWQEAIQGLTAEELRRFLTEHAASNLSLQEDLSILYLRRLPPDLSRCWTALLRGCASRFSSGRYVPAKEVHWFLLDLRNTFYHRFDLLRRVGAVMDAFYWLGAAFETAAQKVSADPFGDFRTFCADRRENWEQLLSTATEPQQEEMLSWFWAHRLAFFAHAGTTLDVDFLFLSWSKPLLRKSLSIADELIEISQESSELPMLLSCRDELMYLLDFPVEEVCAFWEKHLDQYIARCHLLAEYEDCPSLRERIVPLLLHLKEMDVNDLPRLLQDSVWLALFYRSQKQTNAFLAERGLLLTQYRQMLEQALPGITNRKTARQFTALLDTLRSLRDPAVDQMINELVHKLCSSPSVARKGVVEIILSAGYEWPKPYQFAQH